jgi:glycosyltransferase involved in cell wall biosynthesis
VHELNELYNRCVAGLVLSFTNMSLLPLELLSSGTIPVVNSGENNAAVSNNKFIAYTQSSPAALAATLSEIVSRKDSREYAQKAAHSVKNASWEKSGTKFVEIIERETRRKD